ncbi:hypothetical protein CCR97_08735 [Rhodoplanes elegans]|uniref:Uncharacterized protein n=1 Tax=Rhodoplanes elegans TaxID=29408 RepID=A0A327KSP3_9BRAD|nr:hypothetical protein [Rhodoplanes elegans]MBK5958296.1 hypothetical protein [Rhodoplanes elegans]RAI40663.1 hypothetical protein CH338_05455 [Rhodoplanes elegans]
MPSAWIDPSRLSAAALAAFMTWLGHPAGCHRASCRRHGRCLGDPRVCYGRRWMTRSDAAKVWMEAALAAREAGRSGRALARAGDAALIAHVAGLEGFPSAVRDRTRDRSLVEPRNGSDAAIGSTPVPAAGQGAALRSAALRSRAAMRK